MQRISLPVADMRISADLVSAQSWSWGVNRWQIVVVASIPQAPSAGNSFKNYRDKSIHTQKIHILIYQCCWPEEALQWVNQHSLIFHKQQHVYPLFQNLERKKLRYKCSHFEYHGTDTNKYYFIPVLLMRSSTAIAVQGQMPSIPNIKRPKFEELKPSTSLAGDIILHILRSHIWYGKGNWNKGKVYCNI